MSKNSIILCSSLFGSVYLMSISLGVINMWHLENKKIPRELNIINSLTLLVSSSVFICGIYYQICRTSPV